jgi:GntR family transcriptional regulator, rspAB operon transcriptional repressor
MFLPRRRRSLADDIYDELRLAIVTLRMPPGEVVSEKDLCAQFGVSRTPVREALLRLADHGLVEIAPQHATFVAPIDADAVRQAQFLRENLEAPVVRRLCEGTPPDLTRPRALLAEHRRILETGDYFASVPIDDRFHQALFDLAGMGPLWSVIHARKAHLDRIRALQVPEPGKLARVVQEHAEILDAIAARDPDRAETTLRGHVTNVLIALDRLLADRPDLFHRAGSPRARPLP